MKERKVTLIIEEDGSVKLDVEGVKGKSCLDLTADVEAALGQVTQRSKKAEFHQIDTTTAAKQQVQGG